MSNFNFLLVAGDTDGLAIKKADAKPFTPEEQSEIVQKLNEQMDELIRWENDGVFKRQIVIRVKNYILQDESGKVKIKGSGLKATTKEKALQRFISEIIDLLLKDRKDQILFTYLRYAREILELKDMSDWSVKKTVTKSVLSPERTNEERVLDALEGSDYNEGDKVYMFYRTPEELCLAENFDGVYCADTLLKKLYKTLAIFDTVLDIDLFPDFTLKRNRELLGLEPKPKKETLKIVPPLDTKITRNPLPEGFWNTK